MAKTERVMVSLPVGLRVKAKRAAAEEGVQLSKWYARALEAALKKGGDK